MAQTLSSLREPDQLNGLTSDRFFDLNDRYTAAVEQVHEAVEGRKNVRTEVKNAMPAESFDQARKNSEKSGDLRERIDLFYRQIMIWLDKPVGLIAPVDSEQMTVARLKGIDADGMKAGREGKDRHKANTFTPGTEQHQRWDTAYLRGAGERGSPAAEQQPRRGRPPGSKNRPKQPDLQVHEGGAAAQQEPAAQEPGPQQPDTSETRH